MLPVLLGSLGIGAIGSGPSGPPNGGLATGQSGSPVGSAPPGGPGAPTATGPFDVKVGDGSPFSGLGDLGVLRFGGLFEWAVPSLVLTVPGLLLILVVLAQLLGGAIWLPFARRSLGSFGVGRRKRRSRTGATA